MVDKYANIATIELTMSAANTLSFQELITNLGITPDRNKASAMIVDEIEYSPSIAGIAEMTTASDRFEMALCISNAVSDLNDITDRRILHSSTYLRTDHGTAGNSVMTKLPFVYQFFPPLITAERKIYLACNTVGLASAAVLRARIYYRQVEISQGDFIELAEVFRLVG